MLKTIQHVCIFGILILIVTFSSCGAAKKMLPGKIDSILEEEVWDYDVPMNQSEKEEKENEEEEHLNEEESEAKNE